jgi:hypothetical protein
LDKKEYQSYRSIYKNTSISVFCLSAGIEAFQGDFSTWLCKKKQQQN